MNMTTFATFDTIDEAVAACRTWRQAVQGLHVDIGNKITVDIDQDAIQSIPLDELRKIKARAVAAARRAKVTK
jgi:hypothetical protein